MTLYLFRTESYIKALCVVIFGILMSEGWLKFGNFSLEEFKKILEAKIFYIEYIEKLKQSNFMSCSDCTLFHDGICKQGRDKEMVYLGGCIEPVK